MTDKTYTSEGLDPQNAKDMLEKIKDLCLDPAMKQMVSETLDKMEENEEAKDQIKNDPS